MYIYNYINICTKIYTTNILYIPYTTKYVITILINKYNNII